MSVIEDGFSFAHPIAGVFSTWTHSLASNYGGQYLYALKTSDTDSIYYLSNGQYYPAWQYNWGATSWSFHDYDDVSHAAGDNNCSAGNDGYS